MDRRSAEENLVTRREALCLGLTLAGALFLPNPAQAVQVRPGPWVKSSQNPVLSLGQAGAFDSQNIFAPCAVKVDGQYYVYYSGGPYSPANGGDYILYQLGLARSSDGVTFQKTGAALLPLGVRDDFHATPALLRDAYGNLYKPDGLWHMVFCGNRADDLEHATSVDGLSWSKDAANPIYRAAYSPCLLHTGTEYRLYHVHKPSGSPWEIHLATGADLHSLAPHPFNPILMLSPSSWEATALIYPYVLKEGNTWIMFYASYWRTTPLGVTSTAIGMATSDDGVYWTKYAGNPVLKPAAGSAYDSVYTSSQSVFRDGDHYKMFFAGRVDSIHKYYAIGMATWQGDFLVTPSEVKRGYATWR